MMSQGSVSSVQVGNRGLNMLFEGHFFKIEYENV